MSEDTPDETDEKPDANPMRPPGAELADRLRELGGVARTEALETSDAIGRGLTSRSAKWVYVTVFVILMAGGVSYLSWTLAGPLATIVYVFLFFVGLTSIPGIIFMVGNAMPGATALGSLNLILGAFAFGRHALVQTDQGWQWCPAREDAIWIDGRWQEIDGGLEHWSVLGWRPFAVARYKTDETLENVRIDTRAEHQAAGTRADGGADERGGQQVVDPPIESGDDGWWVVDLTRLFTSGLKKIGDIELIETAEEIKMREESGEGRSLTWWQPMVHGTVGLVLGCAIGYAILYM